VAFTSLKFLIFFLITLGAFHKVFPRHQWLVLLVASYAFYCFFSVKAACLLLAVCLVNYLSGLFIDAASEKSKKKFLVAAIIIDVALLVLFKYSNFVIDNINFWRMEKLSLWNLILPVGISFFIFQSISYVLDVYLEKVKPERHLGYFLLYLSFFPKLMQGPIERAGYLLPQLRRPYKFDAEEFNGGLKLILIGLVKKLVIADRLALLTAPVFGQVTDFSGPMLWLAVYAYTFQIYYDFSGYTDMARGMAKLFGIELSENFQKPYLATNIPDFWRRWHMTFSFWLRDYLFTPLMAAFRERGAWGNVAAAMVTFTVCGLWHGATWGFILFGLIHGVYMAVSMLTFKKSDQFVKQLGIPKNFVQAWRVVVTFHLVAFSFIFFRANSLTDVGYILSHAFGPVKNVNPFSFMSSFEVGLVALAVVLLSTVRTKLAGRIAGKLEYFDNYWFYGVLANLIIFFGVHIHAPFIYFKF